MLEIQVKQEDGHLQIACGFSCKGKGLVVETAVAILTIAERAEGIFPGGRACFRELLMKALSSDDVWETQVLPEPDGPVS